MKVFSKSLIHSVCIRRLCMFTRIEHLYNEADAHVMNTYMQTHIPLFADLNLLLTGDE